jgi:hypothetical protein
MGRPTVYSPEIAAEICRRLSAGEYLRAICRDEHMPPESTVREWYVDDREGFAAHYAKARDIALDIMADEILAIADTPLPAEETTEGPDGTTIKRGDAVRRSALMVDARKWYLCKLAPKKYGDRQHVEHSGTVGIAAELAEARKRAKEVE